MKTKILVTLFVFASLVIFPSFSLAQVSAQAPKNLVCNVENNEFVFLSWSPPVDTSVAGFNVYRKDDAGGSYIKVNANLLTTASYVDKSVDKGKSYSYVCRSVNNDGIEGNDSNAVGAPQMYMNTSATVIHVGKVTKIAAPGDTIKYDIDFVNRGFGVAKNVAIIYSIPKGTTFIAGTTKCVKHKAAISYYDEKAAKWLDKVGKQENISKVRFVLLEDIHPVAADKDDTATLKVTVNE